MIRACRRYTTGRVGVPILCAALGMLASWTAAQTTRAQEGDANLTPMERRAVRKYLALRTKDVEEWIHKGRLEKAIELAEALLVIVPDEGGDTTYLRALKNRARDKIQAATLLRGTLEGPTGFLEVGDPLVFRVRIENLSPGTIELDMGSRERGSGIARCRIVFEEHGCLGGVRIDEWDEDLPGFTGIKTLDPGAVWETRLAIDSADHAPLNPTVREYRIEGRVWPLAMAVEGQMFSRPVLLDETSVRVFPRGLGPLRAAPLETMQEGIAEEFGPKTFLAAWFIQDSKRASAVDILVESQGGDFNDPVMPRILRAALRIVTGRSDMPLENGAWRTWWARNGQEVRARATGAGDDSKDGDPGREQ